MNLRQAQMLRAILHTPRTAKFFTHGGEISPHVAECYLQAMEDDGLIEAPSRADGAYKVTAEGRAFLSALPEIAPSRYYGNASTKERYVSEMREPARGAGSMVAYSLKSLGLGA